MGEGVKHGRYTCACGKLSFPSKKKAKDFRRENPQWDITSIYACEDVRAADPPPFHVTTMPRWKVRKMRKSRSVARVRGNRMKTIQDVDGFAEKAHEGQLDKIGVPIIEHVRAVAKGLAPISLELQMAGLLHDVLEDTEYTPYDLINMGLSHRVISIVMAVTNEPGKPYLEKLFKSPLAVEAALVKISDNAHNSRSDRQAFLAQKDRERLTLKYREARKKLWPNADRANIEKILHVVNPELLHELDSWAGSNFS